MKLSEWAKKNGMSYRTAYNRFKVGFIKGAYKLDNGTIVVPDNEQSLEDVVNKVLNILMCEPNKGKIKQILNIGE